MLLSHRARIKPVQPPLSLSHSAGPCLYLKRSTLSALDTHRQLGLWRWSQLIHLSLPCCSWLLPAWSIDGGLLSRLELLSSQSHVVFMRAASHADTKYPLRAASYISCSVDLENQQWVDGLTAEGFDPEIPTCWILEGLVMYLTPAAVSKLLTGMHAASAVGSRALIMVRPMSVRFLRQS